MTGYMTEEEEEKEDFKGKLSYGNLSRKISLSS